MRLKFLCEFVGPFQCESLSNRVSEVSSYRRHCPRRTGFQISVDRLSDVLQVSCLQRLLIFLEPFLFPLFDGLKVFLKFLQCFWASLSDRKIDFVNLVNFHRASPASASSPASPASNTVPTSLANYALSDLPPA